MSPLSRRNMRCSVHVVTCVSFLFCAITVGTLSLSVATTCWLVTREQVTPTWQNGTKIEGIMKFWMKTWSGMWTICMAAEGIDQTSCQTISFDAEASGRDNHAETSMTIIAAIRNSVPFPVAALLLAFIAAILNVMGSIHADVKTLVGSVFYVLAGLCLAVGIILYISAINDEVGYRVSSKKETGGFEYYYGWSFFCAGIAFMSSEMAAVVSVTLYLKRNAKMEDMIRIIPGLEEKVDQDMLRDIEGLNNPTIIL